MLRNHARPAILAIALALLGFVLSPIAALAEGGEAFAALSFLPGVSNWGSTDAAGSAEVNVSEGTISVEARGLKALATDVYEVWLVTPGLAQWVSVGRFSATGGAVDYSAAVDEIPDLDYGYVVITVEPASGDTGEPSGRNAIAGFLVSAEAAAAATQARGLEAASVASVSTAAADDATVMQAADQPATAPPPTYLPVSGAAIGRSLFEVAGAAVGVAVGAITVAKRRS